MAWTEYTAFLIASLNHITKIIHCLIKLIFWASLQDCKESMVHTHKHRNKTICIRYHKVVFFRISLLSNWDCYCLNIGVIRAKYHIINAGHTLENCVIIVIMYDVLSVTPTRALTDSIQILVSVTTDFFFFVVGTANSYRHINLFTVDLLVDLHVIILLMSVDGGVGVPPSMQQ